uniref:Transposase IS200-like domain-containing protein n=1 Tax=Chlorobium chlorochromatii (strain CaD3) TaxID=340177 RepID=Q3ARJ0_CHLCH
MNQYNPNIHHRRSIRLKDYDYTQVGLYFITICCQDRTCRFGRIENGEMILNEHGKIAHNEWMKTREIRPNVELGEFIVMPNHIHAIIRFLRRGELHSPNNNVVFDTPLPFDNGGVFKTPNNTGECNSPLRSPSQTVGAIVRGYKSSVTKQLGLMGFTEKLWQRNYYEHIIQNEQSYQTISEYIINNPAKWQDDKFYVE